MTRLLALRDGVYIELDTEDAQIELNFQIEDVRTPAARQAPFSLSFRLPFTQTNNDFLGHVGEPTLKTSEFNINRKTGARLFEGNVAVMDGIFQVTSIDLSQRKYVCRFYSSLVDIFQVIRGKKWEDVWRDEDGNVDCPLDHPLTVNNVRNAWQGNALSGVGAGVSVGDIHYPLTDNGNMNAYAFPRPAFFIGEGWGDDNAQTGLQPLNLHPAVKLRYLIDQILEYAGYTRTTDFFDDTTKKNDKLYVLVGLQSQVVPTRPAYAFRAQWTLNGNLPTFAFMGVWDTSSTGLYDPDDIFDSTNTYLIPPITGTYVFELTVEQTDLSLSGQYQSTFYIAGADVVAQQSFNMGTINGATPGPITFTFGAYMTAGVGHYCYLQQSWSDSVDVTITLDYVNFFTESIQEGIVDMAAALGEEPLDKWLKGIVETFNLVMSVNELTKEVTFTGYDDYIENAPDPIDWTDKVDWQDGVEMTPATDYQKARLKLTPAAAEDHRNAYYYNSFGLYKGEYNYITRSDFAEGEHTVGDFFGLLRLTRLKAFYSTYGVPLNTTQFGYNIPLIISELWSNAGNRQTQYESLPPMLCYHHGYQATSVIPSGTNIYLADTVVTSMLPLFTTYSGIATDSERIALEYAVSDPDLIDTSVIGTPTADLLKVYWYNYIQRLYSPDTRVLKCRAHLNALDIQQLDFARRVSIENVQYRILAIANYVVGQQGLANLTLLKDGNDDLYDCILTPVIGSDGRIVWYAPDGSIATPSALCCVSYGFYWDAPRQRCSMFGRRLADGDVQRGSVLPGVLESIGGMAEEGLTRVFNNDNLENPLVEEIWQMTCHSTDSSPTVSSTMETNQQLFFVGNNKTVSIIVNWVAVQTSGSNIGTSSSGEDTFLLDTIASTTAKDSGAVFSRGAGGVSVDVVVSDGTNGSKWNVQVSGLAGTDMDWFIDIKTYSYDAQGLTFTVPSIATFQNTNVYYFQDGDIMEWNA